MEPVSCHVTVCNKLWYCVNYFFIDWYTQLGSCCCFPSFSTLISFSNFSFFISLVAQTVIVKKDSHFSDSTHVPLFIERVIGYVPFFIYWKDPFIKGNYKSQIMWVSSKFKVFLVKISLFYYEISLFGLLFLEKNTITLRDTHLIWLTQAAEDPC